MKFKGNYRIFKSTLINKKIYILCLLYFFIIKLEKNLKYNIRPKISVFLPIYNKGIYLKRSISSIQKQTLKSLEIITVNDCSTDKSLRILKKLAKKDKRIKIVNNDRNHGLLYSRSMGILNCTGEYLLNLDPDDMFSNIFNLEILYKMAKKNNTHLILFKLKKIRVNESNNFQLNKSIKDLNFNNSKTIKKRFDYFITNKLMKREIILKAYNFFKIKIYSNKWNYHEDNIWSILINKYIKSKILFNNYIYLHLLNKESLTNNLRNVIEMKNVLYRLQMFQVLYKNNKCFIYKNLLNLINTFDKLIKKDLEIKKKIIHIFINSKKTRIFYS